MSGCPFANLLDPTTYVEGMPCAKLARIREAGPLVMLDDPLTGEEFGWMFIPILVGGNWGDANYHS